LRIFKDQLNRDVQVSFPPKKIISLVPSQTELLYDLGLKDEVIGITKFCVHPEKWFRTKTRIGGTKKLSIEKISALQPDLIIGNKEENEKEQIEDLAKKFPVWISDVKNLNDAYRMISSVGELVGKQEQAEKLVSEIKSEFQNSRLTTDDTRLSSAYLIWFNPLMTIGSNTFIHSMLEIAGFKNSFAELKRYPEIKIEDLKVKSPSYVLLSSEPFPFKQKHLDFFAKELPESKILLVDGEMFSWYGSRLLKAPGYFRKVRSKMN
jgi:ABC-type Fe3+-hydroxamate transport system substrate-binding protein